MRKRIFYFLVLVFIAADAYAQSSAFYPDILLLKIKPQYKEVATINSINNTTLHQVLQQLQQYELRQKFPTHDGQLETTNKFGDRKVDLSLWYSLKYNSDLPPNKIKSLLMQTAVFQYVERRPIDYPLYRPNDPYIGRQYYLRTIHAFDAWNLEKGDSNVVVGIVDTGIDKLHQDLIHGIKYNYQDTVDGIDNDNDGFIDNFCGWDMGNHDNNTQWQVLGHGVFVSGFVSAVPNNHIGIAGVGYNTKVLPVKVDDSLGVLVADYEGIVYAADHGVTIINCSWGGTFSGAFGRDVVNYASNNKGALVVAAAGNSNNDVYLYPASYANVMSCAGTDSLDQRWQYSSYGHQVDICAPATYVYSTWINNSYSTSHGTSFSSPIVAGVAALVKAHFPTMTNWQIREQLRNTADNIDTIAANISTAGEMGTGRVNAYKALIDTLKPGLRFKNRLVQQSNDTLYISGSFINYLHTSSSNLQASISINSTYLVPINNTYTLGSLNTYSSIYKSKVFSARIMPNIPIGFYVDVKVSYTDTNYSSFEYFRVHIDKASGTLDTNKIVTSVNSYSTIGFVNGSRMEGKGFTYKLGRNLLAFGGLLVGDASNRVSNNIYGISGSYDNDFVPISPALRIDTPSLGTQEWLNEYNDNNAGFSKLNIQVNQRSYAFKQSPLDKIVFLEYSIINRGNNALNNIRVGLFMDWDIWKSYANKADFDSSLNLAYTYPTTGGSYAGIQWLSNRKANCYNMDNDGSGNSINIYDGFMNFEKWTCLTTPRHHAGLKHSYGNDVSNILSAGPYSIAQGDTLKLTFALLAGDYKSDIELSAQAAKDWFFNTAAIREQSSLAGVHLLSCSPNPFTDVARLSFVVRKPCRLKVELFDAYGRSVKMVANAKFERGEHQLQLNSKGMKSGVYYCKLTTSKEVISQKIILQK